MEQIITWYFTEICGVPRTDARVLCLTLTKSGKYNFVVGYYAPELGRWVCGMNSNVVAWSYLPDGLSLLEALKDEASLWRLYYE